MDTLRRLPDQKPVENAQVAVPRLAQSNVLRYGVIWSDVDLREPDVCDVWIWQPPHTAYRSRGIPYATGHARSRESFDP